MRALFLCRKSLAHHESGGRNSRFLVHFPLQATNSRRCSLIDLILRATSEFGLYRPGAGGPVPENRRKAFGDSKCGRIRKLITTDIAVGGVDIELPNVCVIARARL